jgi:hypothetical protein
VVNSHYWNKDSNSLFDYEADEYTSSAAKITRNGYIIRKDKDIDFYDKIPKDKVNNTLVAKCQVRNDSFDIDFDDDCDLASVKSIDEKPWLIIRHTGFVGKTGYKIRENDILRLGKSMFKVLEIHIKKERKQKQHGTVAEPNTNLPRDDANVPLDGSGLDDQYNTGLDIANQGVNLIHISRMNKEAEQEDSDKYLVIYD